MAAAAQAAARAPLAGVAERLLEAVATAYPDLAEQQALGHEALGRLLAAVQAVAAEGAEQGADAIAQQLQVRAGSCELHTHSMYHRTSPFPFSNSMCMSILCRQPSRLSVGRTAARKGALKCRRHGTC